MLHYIFTRFCYFFRESVRKLEKVEKVREVSRRFEKVAMDDHPCCALDVALFPIIPRSADE